MRCSLSLGGGAWSLREGHRLHLLRGRCLWLWKRQRWPLLWVLHLLLDGELLLWWSRLRRLLSERLQRLGGQRLLRSLLPSPRSWLRLLL